MPTERAERCLLIAPLAREHLAQRQLLIIQRRIAVRRYQIRGVDCLTEKGDYQKNRARDGCGQCRCPGKKKRFNTIQLLMSIAGSRAQIWIQFQILIQLHTKRIQHHRHLRVLRHSHHQIHPLLFRILTQCLPSSIADKSISSELIGGH